MQLDYAIKLLITFQNVSLLSKKMVVYSQENVF